MRSKLAQRLILGAAAMTLTFGGTIALAQYGPSPQQQQQWDDEHWGHGPQGYGDYYQEQDRPNFGARRGYSTGYEMGVSDRRNGHSYRPTHLDEFKHVPDSPHDVPRDQFKHFYREAFIRGYQRGYGR